MSPRVTARYVDAYAYHASEPVSRLTLARAVGPYGSTRYGYSAIARALRAGVLVIVPPPAGVPRRGAWVQYAAARGAQ